MTIKSFFFVAILLPLLLLFSSCRKNSISELDTDGNSNLKTLASNDKKAAIVQWLQKHKKSLEAKSI